VDQDSPKVIAANGEDKQHHKNAAGFEIKEKAHSEQVDGAEPGFFVNERINSQNRQEKTPEKKVREQEGFVLRKCQYFV
jgi:hypothetical protein